MPYIAVRNPLADAKDTLSSWDKCMAKSYCKWPVIVGIIIGSLIILSVVLCVARCICCGAECAMCCCKCCTGCCGSSKESGHKRMQSEPTGAPPPMYPNSYQSPLPPPQIDNRPVNQQYRSHAAPTFNPAPTAPQPEAPQFATFSSPSKPVNEDALPPMPSWNEARSMQVEEEVVPEKRGDMEMDRLHHNGSVNSMPLTGAAAVAAIPAGRRTPGRSPVQRSPTQDSYGFPPGYQNDSFVSGVSQRDPRNSPGPYANHFAQQQEGYRGSPVQNLSPVYGAGAGFAQNQPYGRRSPSARPVQQFDQGPRYSPVQRPMNEYGYEAPDRSHEALAPPYHAQAPVNNYAPPVPMRSPSPQYTPSESTRFEPPTPAPSYPGQQTYDAGNGAYPGQQSYQAYQPAAEPQQAGVMRKPLDGSWKEL